MRFADLMFRLAPVAATVALASGCAILTGPEVPAAEPAQQPKAAAPAPQAKSAATKGGEATKDAAKSAAAQASGKTEQAAAPPPPAEPPIDPGVQRAYESARRALAAGRLDEAERGFVALTKSNPELGGPFANLGIVYRQKGKLDEAVKALEQAVQVSPKQPMYLNQLGIAYRMVGQFTKARDAYEKAIALDPNYALALLNLGILYDVYLWDGARALALYDRYLALSPGGDDKVKKWASDLRHRSQPRSLAARKEQG